MTTDRKKPLKITIILVGSAFIAAHLCFLLLPDLFESWNAQTIDRFFRFRSDHAGLRPHYDDTIVHVDLTNTTLKQLNNFYLNRGHYAQLIRNLTEMNVSAQMLDFIFASPRGEEYDRALIHAARKAGNVYVGMALRFHENSSPEGQEPMNRDIERYLDATKWHILVEGDASSIYRGSGSLVTFPELAIASRGSGFLNLIADRDGTFRRMPLLVRFKDDYYPAFAFRAVCDYLQVPPGNIFLRPGKTITLKGAKRPDKDAVRDIVIPIDRFGNMLINYLGPWEQMKHYNFADVYRAGEDREEMELWKEELSGKIVVVSELTTGSSDLGPVPTDSLFPLSGIHANIFHAILTGAFLREVHGLTMSAVELGLLSLILILSLRFSSFSFTLGSVGLGSVYLVATAFLFFSHQIVLNVVRPLLATGFSLIAVLTYRYIHEEKEKEVLRKTFEAYFPPSIIKKIMSNPGRIASGGQKKELTVLFSDIKDFTRHSSTMSPDHIQELLNEYFEAMTDIVFSYQGTVDKFIGDGLMVFFGDPDPQPDHALRCVRAAVEMQKKVNNIGRRWESQGDMPLQIRIGINTDQVVVGNMGSARRLSYTVLGSAVNLAQRLESNAPVGGIMISERTHDLVKDHVKTRSLGEIRVKGFEEAVRVYEVIIEGE